MSDLSSLIARLKKAEGPDRGLDGDIHNGVFGTAYVRAPKSVTGFVTSISDNGCPDVPAYTSSIDAAVSLAERALPGLSKIQPETYVGGEFHHCEIETEEGDFEAHNCPNVAIAICLATLRALQQKGSSNG